MADGDEALAHLFLAKLDNPADGAAVSRFAAESLHWVALAGRILIEQSDLVIGVWDGATTTHVGGTGHTIAVALELGSPVIVIDPAQPERWRTLLASEALATVGADYDGGDRVAVLTGLVQAALDPGSDAAQPGFTALQGESWHETSNPLVHGYRRIEALFGGDTWRQKLRSLRQRYEHPGAIEGGSGKAFLDEAAALPGADADLVRRIGSAVMRRLAWSDRVSSHLSDAYRGGMTFNFVLSSLAIVAGIMYLPFVGVDYEWLSALAELLLLSGILVITIVGQRRQYHTR